ncbi:beta-ketoacyl-ACP synthase, partial [Vibrio breoganii]
MTHRVVVTGMSGVTAFGNDWQHIEPKLKACENATQYMPSFEQYDGLNT